MKCRKNADKFRTVVRIHINAATFAPIAHAPAMPPLAADAADFSTISRNDNCFLAATGGASLLMMENRFFSFNIVYVDVHCRSY
jgi:hypothetical protein